MTAPATALTHRVDALRRIVHEGLDLLPHDALEDAAAVVRRAEGRLRHGTNATVVALAGATGSGKSSLFNAIVGEPVSPVGVMRPTTEHVRAAVFGAESVDELLQWLEVRHRHGLAGGDLDGLVLLDLPDHDSVVTSHRLEVDRLVELVDVLVWVLDPQKYADEAVHRRYLMRLAEHTDSMLFVLNQSDRVPADDHQRWAEHAASVLAADGIARPVILHTSAASGAGLDELRTELAGRIASREAALAKIDADLRRIGSALDGVPRPQTSDDAIEGALLRDLANAAGADLVAGAVAAGYRFDARKKTGWPFARWLLRLRRHPLRALWPAPAAPDQQAPDASTAIPIDRPRLDLALRRYADARSGDVDPRWARSARTAARQRTDDLPAALGQIVRSVAGESVRPPRWWRWAGAAQTFFAWVAAAGALWLAALLVLEYLRVPTEDLTPHLGNWPVPTLLLLGGAGVGLILAFLAGLAAGSGAKRRARRAARTIGREMRTIGAKYVVAPLEAELERWDALAADLALVAGGSPATRVTR